MDRRYRYRLYHVVTTPPKIDHITVEGAVGDLGSRCRDRHDMIAFAAPLKLTAETKEVTVEAVSPVSLRVIIEMPIADSQRRYAVT